MLFRSSHPSRRGSELFAHINWKQLEQGLFRSPLADHVGTLLKSDLGEKRNVPLPDFVQEDPPRDTFFLQGF